MSGVATRRSTLTRSSQPLSTPTQHPALTTGCTYTDWSGALRYHEGTALIADDTGRQITNFPQQQYDNGVAKNNDATKLGASRRQCTLSRNSAMKWKIRRSRVGKEQCPHS